MLKKIAFGSIGLMFLVSPLIASAQVSGASPTLEQQLSALYAQLIVLLQQELALLQGGGGSSGAVGSISYTPSSGTVALNFSNSVTQRFSATPLSGAAPLAVSFSGVVSGTSYQLTFGDGTSTQTGNCSTACSSIGVNTTHTYGAAGSYVATLKNLTDASNAGSVTIAVQGAASSSGMLAISGLDAPTNLAVNQTGSWTVHAVAASSTQRLSYSIDWGDQSPLGAMATSAAAQVTLATFTHAYGATGTYMPVFIVSGGGQTASTSVSVVVGGGGPVTNGQLTASLTAGPAPLSVRFTTNVTTASGIDFGDGTRKGLVTCNDAPQAGGAPAGTREVGCKLDVTHLYSAPGVFTAKLVDYYCAQGTTRTCSDIGLGTIAISVSTPSAGGYCVASDGSSYTNGQTIFGSSLTGGGAPQGPYGSSNQNYTCQNGTWACTTSNCTPATIDPAPRCTWGYDSQRNSVCSCQAGLVSVRGICTKGDAGPSCTTPWDSQQVRSGASVLSQPYFTNGLSSGAASLQMRCVNGLWYRCNPDGSECTAWNGMSIGQARITQLAAAAAADTLRNVLTALESALKALLVQFSL